MSKKAEIRLGINSSDAKKEAKKVSQEIKKTIESDLRTGVEIKVGSKEAESIVERMARKEREAAQKLHAERMAHRKAEDAAMMAAIKAERAAMEGKSGIEKRNMRLQAEVAKKLEKVQNMAKNYATNAEKFPSIYKGTPTTLKDANNIWNNAEAIKGRLGTLPNRELSRLQMGLDGLSYRDLAKFRDAINQMTHETLRASKMSKSTDQITASLDKMKMAVDRMSSAMEKSVKKIAPTADKAQAAATTTAPVIDAATKAATKATAAVVKEVKEEETAKPVAKASTTNATAEKVAEQAIDPAALRNQFMATLEHFQSTIAKTMPKADTAKGQEKIANIRDLQDRFSKSAILTTQMTTEQMNQVSAQMTRMASTTVREMQRGMTAIERMFKKMATEASKIDTSVLNYERKRQAGERNLQTGMFRPSARSDTSDDIASRMIKLLPAPKYETKLLEGPKGVDPSTYIKPLISQQQRAAESMAKAMERAAQAAELLRKQQIAENERGWSADYTGPLKRERKQPLALPASPQEQLNNIFGKINLSALDKLAARLKSGEIPDASKVPGGVASAQAAPNQLRGILDAIPKMNNEAAHALLKQAQGLKFTNMEATINSIEMTFQNINNLLASNAQKMAQAQAQATSGTDKASTSTTTGAQQDPTARVADMMGRMADQAAKMAQASVEGKTADDAARETAKQQLAAQQAAAQQELIASARKVMNAFDILSEKIKNNASLSDIEKEQWAANAKGVKSAMRSVEGAAGTAAPEATRKAARMIDSADVSDAVQLRNMLEQISHTLGLSKQTLLREAAREARNTSQATDATDKSIKQVMKSFQQSSRAAQFLSNNTDMADRAARKLKGTWEEVKRVVQGIMISRIFYAGLQQVSAMAREVGNLIVQFEQAHVAMSVMLGDYDKSTRLMNEFADFAAKTPLTNQQANKAGQMLLAYGFQAKNIMPIMRDLADATAAVGRPEAFESIARALGQINTKGKLSAEELRQLTEQGIPALAIIRKELGLTEKQVANIGKAGIPAEAAISALLKGIQARYAGAAEAVSKTTGGMLSTIKDSILLVAKDALEPLKNVFDGILSNMVEKFDFLIDTLRSSGVGGVFEAIIPPEMQDTFRVFAANIFMLISALSKLWQALAPVREMFLNVFVLVANTVLPIVSVLVIALANLVNMIASNAKFMQILTAALAGFAIGYTVTKMVFLLSKGLLFMVNIMRGAVSAIQLLIQGKLMLGAVSTLTAGKVAVLVGVLAGLLAIIAALSGKFNGFFNNFAKGVQGMFKIDSSKFFQKDMKDNTASVEEFGEEFDKNGEAIDKWGDKMKKNADKAKNAIMSFDEVFTLTDPDAGKMDDLNGSGDDVTSPEIEMPDIGGMPEIPDESINWDDFFNLGNFLDNFDSLIAWFKDLGKYFTSEYWRGLKNGNIWDTLKEGLAETIDGIDMSLDGLAEMIAGILTGDLAMFGEGWWRFWTGLGEAVKGLGTIVEGIVTGMIGKIDEFMTWLLGDAWTSFKTFNANLGEDAQQMAEGIKSIWDGMVDFLVGLITLDFAQMCEGWKGIIDGVANFIQGSTNFIIDLFGNIIDYLLGDFLRNFGWVGNTLADMLGSVRDGIKAIINNIKRIFGGLVDFVAGVFTGDWSRAWNGVKNVFSGILSGIGNIFVTILNSIIDAGNWFIRQLNKISFDLPDIMGGKHIGVDIPEIGRIPYLETGGLVTKETLAVMGEKGKHEAVLPLENSSAMSEIARAITEQMHEQPTGTNTESSGEVNLNVGVLVADDKSIRKLKQMLDDVSKDMKRGRRG